MALIRVPRRGKVYGGAKTTRGDKRTDPAFVRTEQFDSPKGQKTYVKASRFRRVKR